MAFLTEHNRHPTAAEIFEAVNRVDPRSSRATTYNNLRDLVQAGWCVQWPWRAGPRDTMRKACGITTSFATAAAMLRTWLPLGKRILRECELIWVRLFCV
jgi:hypothetical protein